MNPREMTAKVDMEYCTLCTRGFPHVSPRQYSPLEIVEDARGFVDYLKCKDIKKCAEHMSTVDWSKVEADCRRCSSCGNYGGERCVHCTPEDGAVRQ